MHLPRALCLGLVLHGTAPLCWAMWEDITGKMGVRPTKWKAGRIFSSSHEPSLFWSLIVMKHCLLVEKPNHFLVIKWSGSGSCQIIPFWVSSFYLFSSPVHCGKCWRTEPYFRAVHIFIRPVFTGGLSKTFNYFSLSMGRYLGNSWHKPNLHWYLNA